MGPITILMAEDDADDRAMALDAVAEAGVGGRLRFVEDGEQLLDYLRREGRYGAGADAPRPGIVLLDLNMPRLGGHEALRAMKADASLRRIPVVVLTTSSAESDVARSYDLGASSFVTKPETFAALVDTVRELGRYWLGFVRLPADAEGPADAT